MRVAVLQDKHRQLARVRHAEEKAAKKAAAREEQARLTMEERTRIAVTASCLRSLRASQLRPADAAMPSPSPIEAAFLAAAQKNKTAGDCPVSVLWNLRPSAQQLQTVSDIIANNR